MSIKKKKKKRLHIKKQIYTNVLQQKTNKQNKSNK